MNQVTIYAMLLKTDTMRCTCCGDRHPADMQEWFETEDGDMLCPGCTQ